MRDLIITDKATLLSNVASVYPGTSRVLMEYCDNSLDDAEVMYEENSGSYPRPIKITYKIDRAAKTITVLDNCRGMQRLVLLGLVQQVGESRKKAQAFLNGQFGFGFHAFRASNKVIEVFSKTPEDGTWKMVVPRDANQIEDEVKVVDSEVPYPSGTKVVLRDFFPDWWREVGQDDLVDEIEQHFGPLLERPDLEVNVEEGGLTRTCRPFDISLLAGKDFDFDIDRVTDSHRLTTVFPQPVKVRLKVVTDPQFFSRRPLFVNNGRRIEEVAHLKSFMSVSARKGKVWSHQNLVGTIEISQNLNPDIKRSDFQNSPKRTPIYKAIVDIEEQIHQELVKVIQNANADNLDKFAGHLTRLLAELARQDNILQRQILQQTKASATEYEEAEEGQEMVGFSDKHGEKPGKTAGGDIKTVKEGPGGIHAEPKRAPGFDIRFDGTEYDALLQPDGTVPRSNLAGDTINIYVNHPDFQERVSLSQHGEMKLTGRLAAYLSSIIAAEYKQRYYEKNKLQLPVKQLLAAPSMMFSDHLSFANKIETRLQPNVGDSLNKIGASA